VTCFSPDTMAYEEPRQGNTYESFHPI